MVILYFDPSSFIVLTSSQDLSTFQPHQKIKTMFPKDNYMPITTSPYPPSHPIHVHSVEQTTKLSKPRQLIRPQHQSKTPHPLLRLQKHNYLIFVHATYDYRTGGYPPQPWKMLRHFCVSHIGLCIFIARTCMYVLYIPTYIRIKPISTAYSLPSIECCPFDRRLRLFQKLSGEGYL